jgi:hypothetical protein
MSVRKGASRLPGIVEVSSLSVVRGEDGGLTLTLRYSYEGRPPSFGKRVEMAKKMLREPLDRLENGNPADLGFAEDAVRRMRTDHFGA